MICGLVVWLVGIGLDLVVGVVVVTGRVVGLVRGGIACLCLP